MPFGLSKRRDPRRVVVSSPIHYAPEKYCGMVLRLNIDCNACCRKLRRIVLNMKGIETHMIEAQQRKLFVCGRFVPSDAAIHIRKKMNRRVEILEVQELGSETSERDQTDINNNPNPSDRPPAENNNPPGPHASIPMVYPGQLLPSSYHHQPPNMPLAYCKSSPYSSAMEIVQVWDDNNCDYCMCVTTEEEDELPLYEEHINGLEQVPSWEGDDYDLDYYY